MTTSNSSKPASAHFSTPYPTINCVFSGKPAINVCIHPECNRYAFICRECPDLQCESLHNHGEFRLRRVADALSMFNHPALMTTYIPGLATSKQLEESRFSGKHKNTPISERLIPQLDEIISKSQTVIYYIKELVKRISERAASAQKNAKKPNLRIILVQTTQKLRSGEVSGLRGAQIRKCMDLIKENNLFEEEDEETQSANLALRNQLKIGTDIFKQMLDQVLDRLRKFEIQDIKNSKIQVLNKRISKREQEDAQPLVERADYFAQLGELYNAKNDLDRAVLIEKGNNPNTLLLRGKILMQLKQLDKAKNDFDLCISLDQRSAEAYVARGDIYYANRKLQEAEREYTIATQIQPGISIPNRKLVKLRLAGTNSKACNSTSSRSGTQVQFLN